MKTPCLFKLLVTVALIAGFAQAQGRAASVGDDPAALHNGSPAPGSLPRTDDPNAPAPTTIQPPVPVRYGWPEAAEAGWNMLPPLPDVRYAVVPLIGHNWPNNSSALALDDLGDVLAQSASGYQLFLWKPGSGTVAPSYVSVPLDPTWLPLTPSATIVLPPKLRPLSSDGKVAGGIFKVGHRNEPGGVAAVWSSATGLTTSLSPLLSVLEDASQPVGSSNFGRSVASVVNASGQTLGWEWHHGLDGNGNLADSLGGTIYDPVGSSTGLLGSDADATVGPYYFPASLNDGGVSVMIKSINGPDSAHLMVVDSTDEYNLGQIRPSNGDPGLSFQSLTNGVTLSGDDALVYTEGGGSNPVTLTQPVVLALATPDYSAPNELWLAHGWPGGPGGETQGWSEAGPVELWDVAHNQIISDRIAPPTFVRSNNQLEIILGDNRLVRNERIYDLNTRLAPRDCWRISVTVDINNSGTILAYATQVKNPDGSDIPAAYQVTQPVLLVPSVLVVDTNPAGDGDPNWLQTGSSVAVGFVPVASELQSWTELISGRDYITNEPVSQYMAAAGVVLNLMDAGGLLKAGKLAIAERKGGTALARELGNEGEKAVGIIGPKKAITIPGSGQTRFPDQVIDTTKTLWEVKNVSGVMNYTQQLRDYVTFCQAKGYTFTLWLKQGTELSGPLLEAKNAGLIIIKDIPPLP